MTTTIKKYSADSGIVGDGITNDSTLTLEGTATVNGTVRVYDGETLLGTTTANSSGTWSYTTGALSNGTHSFTAATTSTISPSSWFPDASTTGVSAGASLTNSAGTFTSSYAGQIIDGLNVQGQILVTHPGVIVRNCQASNIVTTAENTTIEDCTVVGYNGDSGISGIVLLADNATIQRCDVSGVENGIWLEASNCLIQDNYLHDLIPWDPVRDPHSDGLQIPGGAGVSNNVILHNNFDLALASDPYADNGVNACITMRDATNLDIVNNRLNGGGYSIYFDWAGSSVDVTNNVFVGHVYGAWVGEAAGAQTFSGNIFGDTAVSSTTSTATDTSAPLVVTVDTVAPTAPTIATPTNNSDGGLNLTGTAEANSVVSVFDGTTQIGTATANSSGGWSYTTGNLADGSHSFTARATDAAGNTGATSSVVMGSTGTSPTPTPTPPPTAPAAPTISSFSNDSGVAGDGITNDNTLTLKGAAAANGTVNVFDGTTQIGTATADSSGAWYYTTTVLADGNHNLTATVTDGSGQTSAASSALAVRVDTTAPTAPSISSYTSDGTMADSATMSLAAATTSTTDATDVDHLTLNGTAEANSTVQVFDGATEIGTATTDSSGSWNYTASDLADGSHSFTSRAVDAAGNISEASTALNVNVDTQTEAPTEMPTVEFTSIRQKWNDKVVLQGTADPNAQISIYDNGGKTPVAEVKAGADGTFRVTTSSRLSDDEVHRFTATVMDSTGQAEPTSGSVILGTRGGERLTSTSGNDLFRGNGGHDTFEFAANFGQDVITDFRSGRRGHDVVEFSKTVFDDFADVLSHASQSGRDVVIDAGEGNTLTLKNTALSSLDRTDFHFV